MKMKIGKLFKFICYALLMLFCDWGEGVQVMPVLHDQPHYFYTELSEPSRMFLETGAFFIFLFLRQSCEFVELPSMDTLYLASRTGVDYHYARAHVRTHYTNK
jgi:hypothetical protein